MPVLRPVIGPPCVAPRAKACRPKGSKLSDPGGVFIVPDYKRERERKIVTGQLENN